MLTADVFTPINVPVSTAPQLFIGAVETCGRRKGVGLVFHHGRFGTTHPFE